MPAETIEKDYIISWILHCISKTPLKNEFVFCGGTAIKRVYFQDHRFSEDIDLLSDKKIPLEKIVNHLECLKHAQNETNLLINIDHKTIQDKKDRIQMYLHYDGFDAISGVPKEIRLDFTMNRERYGKTNVTDIIKTYSDLKDTHSTLSVMSLETILATKLGLLFDITRNEPRDVYDIWFLLDNVNHIENQFNQVLDIFKQKYSFRLSLSSISSKLKNQSIEKNWNMRLMKQIPLVPSYHDVIQKIEIELINLFN